MVFLLPTLVTATPQEVTRRHKNEKWALDDVVLVTNVTDQSDLRKIKYPPNLIAFRLKNTPNLLLLD